MTDKRNSNGTDTAPATTAAKKPRVTKARAAKATTAAAKPGVTKARVTRGAPRKAAATKRTASSTAKTARQTAQTATAQLKGEAVKLKDQAAGKAREFATSGKDKATGALDGFSKLIGDAAGQVDDRMGAQYGDYARTAADAVAGLAASLRGKEVDDLVNDARDLVRKSPAVAIGAAAALGFIFVRLLKSGSADAKPAKAQRKTKAATGRSKTN